MFYVMYCNCSYVFYLLLPGWFDNSINESTTPRRAIVKIGPVVLSRPEIEMWKVYRQSDDKKESGQRTIRKQNKNTLFYFVFGFFHDAMFKN
jgi:hypothetical protein